MESYYQSDWLTVDWMNQRSAGLCFSLYNHKLANQMKEIEETVKVLVQQQDVKQMTCWNSFLFLEPLHFVVLTLLEDMTENSDCAMRNANVTQIHEPYNS